MDDATLDRLAELAVRFGSNVQPGQIVAVGAEVGKERVARAVAAQAYAAGAKFVDVSYFDLRVKRARIENAAEDTLDFVPSWYGERLLALGDQRAARVGLSGPADPHALEGLDPARVGKDLLPGLRETGKVVNDATTNWTIIPAITRASWANRWFGSGSSTSSGRITLTANSAGSPPTSSDRSPVWSTVSRRRRRRCWRRCRRRGRSQGGSRRRGAASPGPRR